MSKLVPEREKGSRRQAITAASARGRQWIDHRDAASFSGIAIRFGRLYRDADGALQSALLALYIFVAVFPAVLVMEEYLERRPIAFANSLVHHYNLSAPTAELVRGVLAHDRTHELGSALFAIAGALFFGLGFGRVLQLVHVRVWRLPLVAKQSDQGRYALVLLGVYGLILLLLVQLKELAGHAAWERIAVAPGWIALLVLFFIWAPRLLTHDLVSRRDLLPGALLTAAGIVVLMLVSSSVGDLWVNLYARDYGGFGVVMAIFFWIAFLSAVIVGAATAAPLLADRRRLRRERARSY